MLDDDEKPVLSKFRKETKQEYTLAGRSGGVQPIRNLPIFK